MAAINGVEDSFVRAIIAERKYRVLVAAMFNLALDKEESGPEVVDRFLRLLSDAHESVYVRVGGWN